MIRKSVLTLGFAALCAGMVLPQDAGEEPAAEGQALGSGFFLEAGPRFAVEFTMWPWVSAFFEVGTGMWQHGTSMERTSETLWAAIGSPTSEEFYDMGSVGFEGGVKTWIGVESGVGYHYAAATGHRSFEFVEGGLIRPHMRAGGRNPVYVKGAPTEGVLKYNKQVNGLKGAAKEYKKRYHEGFKTLEKAFKMEKGETLGGNHAQTAAAFNGLAGTTIEALPQLIFSFVESGYGSVRPMEQDLSGAAALFMTGIPSASGELMPQEPSPAQKSSLKNVKNIPLMKTKLPMNLPKGLFGLKKD